MHDGRSLKSPKILRGRLIILRNLWKYHGIAFPDQRIPVSEQLEGCGFRPLLGPRNKHLQQQSEHTTREDPEDWKDISVCFSFHTHLSPYLNRATLIRKMQRLSTLLLPSKQTHHRNPYLQYSPLLGARLETGVHFTYF